MKYKIPSFFLLSLLVLLAYQNCSNSLNLNASEGDAESVNVLSVEMSDLKQIRFWTFVDPRNPVEWIFNLKKGELIEKTTTSQESHSIYCFVSEDFNALQEFINANSLCQKQVITQDEYCTQNYKNPMAFLDFSDKAIPLGEEKDGCARGRIDFCNKKTDEFLSKLENLISKRLSVRCL